MLRGILLFALGFAVAHRLENKLARRREYEQDRDEAWADNTDMTVADSFPASDPPSYNAGTSGGPDLH